MCLVNQKKPRAQQHWKGNEEKTVAETFKSHGRSSRDRRHPGLAGLGLQKKEGTRDLCSTLAPFRPAGT
jgi:hypothetical protein